MSAPNAGCRPFGGEPVDCWRFSHDGRQLEVDVLDGDGEITYWHIVDDVMVIFGGMMRDYGGDRGDRAAIEQAVVARLRGAEMDVDVNEVADIVTGIPDVEKAAEALRGTYANVGVVERTITVEDAVRCELIPVRISTVGAVNPHWIVYELGSNVRLQVTAVPPDWDRVK